MSARPLGSPPRGLLLAAVVLGASLAVTGAALAVNVAQARSNDIPISKIPASVRSAYEGYEQVVRLQANPYAKWKAPKAPWKFCLNESLLQNTWRQFNLAEL